jgi:hypothetical protein
VAVGKDPAALKRAAKATATQTAAEVAADTVERLANDFIEKHAKRRTRPNTQRQTEHILRDIVLPAWRHRTVHDIKRRDVIALIEHVAEGRPIQANRTLAVLSKFFNWLCQRDIVAASPCAGVAQPAKARPVAVRRRNQGVVAGMRRRRRADGCVHQGVAVERPEALGSRWHALGRDRRRVVVVAGDPGEK